MNQTHRDRVKEATSKRREYLRKKTALRSNVIGSGVWTLFCLLATALCVVLTCITLFWAFTIPGQVPFTAPVMLAPFTTWMAFQTRRYFLFLQDAKHADATLPYIPPVAEQLANLPAEEVLLRGSDQPAATPDELLRTVQAGKETAAEELLRAGRQYT